MSVRPSRQLEEDRIAGRLRSGAHPGRLANMAWIMAQGLLSLTATLGATGGTVRRSVGELTEEMCATLRRAAVGSQPLG